ncbi:MAG: 30S ribosomal protein S4 [Myxococcota bacterium]
MARYRGPRLKVIRRLGALLPGLMRTPADLRRPYPPGQHGPTKRGKLSDYALRLREKQKACFHYGVTEKQMRRYMGQAFRGKGNPGLLLLQALESRLDNVVFRAGFARTVRAARQIVRHGHIEVNGKFVDIPSLRLQPGDTLVPGTKSKLKEQMAAAWKDPSNIERPSYLECVEETPQAKVTGAPGRDDVPVRLQEQMIVEYYSGK